MECFSSRAQAETFLAGTQVAPQTSPTPSASASASPTPSPSAAWSVPGGRRLCLTSPTGDEIECFDSRAQAHAEDAFEVEVTGRSFCILPAAPEPSPTPSPSASGTRRRRRASSDLPPRRRRRPRSPIPTSRARRRRRATSTRERRRMRRWRRSRSSGRTSFAPSASAGRTSCSVRREQAEELRRQSGQERLLRDRRDRAAGGATGARDRAHVGPARGDDARTDEEQDRPGAAPRRSRTRRSSTWPRGREGRQVRPRPPRDQRRRLRGGRRRAGLAGPARLAGMDRELPARRRRVRRLRRGDHRRGRLAATHSTRSRSSSTAWDLLADRASAITGGPARSRRLHRTERRTSRRS